jgi:hypothetical protein
MQSKNKNKNKISVRELLPFEVAWFSYSPPRPHTVLDCDSSGMLL